MFWHVPFYLSSVWHLFLPLPLAGESPASDPFPTFLSLPRSFTYPLLTQLLSIQLFIKPIIRCLRQARKDRDTPSYSVRKVHSKVQDSMGGPHHLNQSSRQKRALLGAADARGGAGPFSSSTVVPHQSSGFLSPHWAVEKAVVRNNTHLFQFLHGINTIMHPQPSGRQLYRLPSCPATREMLPVNSPGWREDGDPGL